MDFTGKQEFNRRSRHLDNRLMKREFREFIQLVVIQMEGGDWFDMVIEFLVSSVEVSTKGYNRVQKGV